MFIYNILIQEISTLNHISLYEYTINYLSFSHEWNLGFFQFFTIPQEAVVNILSMSLCGYMYRFLYGASQGIELQAHRECAFSIILGITG